MKYEIVELEEFSGSEAKVYSIIPAGEEETLFDMFLDEYWTEYEQELKEITTRIETIGHTTGAREIFFKHEGDREFSRKYGRYVWALYDTKGSHLRLFCIRFSNVAIILGGGGFKDKSIIKWQDDPKLSQEARKIIDYAKAILDQIDNKEISWSKDGTELVGKLKNYRDD